MGRPWQWSVTLIGSLLGTTQHVVHEIRLTGRFDPAIIEAHAGDSLRFVNGMGGPHNIQFVVDSIPAPMRALLERAMPGDKIGPLSSPLLIDNGEAYGFRIPDLEPGPYPFFCLPHMANMRGVLVIVR
jgi:plastocyanin